jgi:DNA ligase-associated metallophosphoesterase
MSEDVALDIEGETVLLHPERAAVWRERRTVLVADTHFGKSALFRRHGVAVPDGSDELDRSRLARVIRATRSIRLIILGDFLHAPLASDSREAADVEAWCAALDDVEIVVLAGNHDRGALDVWRPPLQWHIGDLIEPPFRFTHDAARPVREGSALFTVSGHVHPVARIGASRTRAPRVPVFWKRQRGLVLPAFGVFTGGAVVIPRAGEQLYAAGPERVLRLR